jgi:hypothetical protein
VRARPAQPPSVFPPRNASGNSTPPSAQSAGPAISDECRRDVSSYSDATQAHDSDKAMEAYRALNHGCPDLVRKAVAKSGAPFPERRMGSLTSSVFGACLSNPDACNATRAPTPVTDGRYAGNGGNVDWNQAIGFANSLMGLLSAGMSLNAAMHGGTPGVAIPTTDMRSLAGPIIRNGVGQGRTALRPAPPTRSSTITGQ